MKKDLNHTVGTKRGISPIVLLLFCFSIIIVILCISFTPADEKNENSKPSPPVDGSVLQDNGSAETDDSVQLPINSYTEDAYLEIEDKVINFPSGGYVRYGYPRLILSNGTVSDTINGKLHDLVDAVILPKAQELALENAPDSKREYDFRLSVSDEYYSVIVTIDIKEGITTDYQALSWNFLKTDGRFLDLNLHCHDRYGLAKRIDSCIKNITSFDPLIHDWLETALTAEPIHENFSYYFHGEHFVAVVNKRFRLHSLDRSPILIEVPYEQIKSYLTLT